jgi:hypothetical protein
VPVPSKGQTVIARAGSITFTSSSATQPPPKVSKEVARWSAEQAYQHTVVMGNDGEVINRILTFENGATCMRDVVCDQPLRFWGKGAKPRHIAIYAHGGLNSEDASVQRIQTLAPYFKANGVYPVFLTWRTGPTETLAGILDDELKKVPRPEGDIGDLFERVKETAAEVLDRTVEVLARPAAKPIWSQMKQNAASAVGESCARAAAEGRTASGDSLRRAFGRLDHPRASARPAAQAQSKGRELSPVRACVHGAFRPGALRARDGERRAGAQALLHPPAVRYGRDLRHRGSVSQIAAVSREPRARKLPQDADPRSRADVRCEGQPEMA